MQEVYCLLRQTWVLATPEECVRQALVFEMIENLHFPRESIVMEKKLSQIPHLKGRRELPSRRADLVVLAKGIHKDYPIYPLLLIECKAVSMNEAVLRQIVGYNEFIGAPYIALANQDGVYMGRYFNNIKDYLFKKDLPSYDILMTSVKIAQDPL